MVSTRSVRLLVVVATVAAVVSWPATPALAFTEGSSNNFFGTGAGDNNSTGGNNSFFGGSAGFSNSNGSGNSLFGMDAGLNNTTGDANSFFGQNAGNDNSTGSFNAFVGADAGEGNTTGNNNAFVGADAGEANTTGSDNAFFGFRAGFANLTGSSNAFLGGFAGETNSTGGFNAFFGNSAGLFNTTASFNAFFGQSAGRFNTTGFDNAFFGQNAGFSNTTGASNAFFGQAAGFSNTTGSSNAFFGEDAGLSNTAGSGNTFLGTLSDGVAGILNATAVGHRARVLQSNSLILGSTNGVNGATSNVDVGIGTTTPDHPLHVRRSNGAAKVLVEEASGTTLGRELFELVNNGATRFRVRNTSNNATWDFQSSSGGGSFVIDRVGGPVSLDFEVQPDGDLVMRGSVTGTSFISSSDRNLKTDITPAKAAKLMSLLRQLDISTWRFKKQAKGTVNLGPMAQDFHRLFGMGTETTIDVRDLASLALVAAQALDEQNQDLQEGMASQQMQIDALERAVAQLSSRG